MPKDLVLNELSVKEAQNIHSARQLMAQLIATLAAATRAGSNRSLRTHDAIDALLLAADYPMSRWRNDPLVEREQRSLLRSLLTKSPFLSAEDGADILERNLRNDFLFRGRSARGLGTALLLDALPVSIMSDPCWDCYRIAITCQSLEESTGELIEESAELPHACRPEHLTSHLDWLAGRDLDVCSGENLWHRREALYPALTFCDRVGDQISEISAGNPLLRQIHTRLSQLDRYFRSWEGKFDPAAIPMKITPESDGTLRKYETEHSFICPDGVKRLFSWHGRLTPGAWRIYFLPAFGSAPTVVGHIGRKLPNILYPT